MLRKVIVLLIISLFIGQILVSSIHSKVINNKDENLVKIEVEICGLKRDKYSVFLTEEMANNVDKLFIDMRSKLENGSNTNVVFNDAVEQLYKYGILGGISVEEAQKLVNNPRKIKSYNDKLDDNNENFLKISGLGKTPSFKIPMKISSFSYIDTSWENKDECSLPNVVYGTAIIINGEAAAGALVEVGTKYGTLTGKVYSDGGWQVSGGIFLDGIPMNVTITLDKWQGIKHDIYRGSPTNVGEIILDAITIAADIRFEDDCYLFDEMIQFYGDIYGGEPPFTWFWDFDDGTISTEQNPVHRFSSAGVYNISLSISDVNGDNDTDIVPFEIYSTIQVYPSFKDGIYYPEDPVQFYGDVCGGDPLYSWYWDFDDGGTSLLRNPIHEFKSGGIFNVSLTVKDGEGRTNTGYVLTEIIPFYEIVGTALYRFYSGTPFCDEIINILLNIYDLFNPTGVIAKFIEKLILNLEDVCSICSFFRSFFIPVHQSSDISIGSVYISYEDLWDETLYPSYGWVWVNGSGGVRSWEGDLVGTLGVKIVYDWIYGSSVNYIGVKDFYGIYVGGKYFGNCFDVGIKEV